MLIELDCGLKVGLYGMVYYKLDAENMKAEIAALRQPSGAPYLEFTGKAARFMAQNHLQAHLSLTHEAGLAGAFVVLERVE